MLVRVYNFSHVFFFPPVTPANPLCSSSSLSSLSAKEPDSDSQWRLCFKLYCLLDADAISVDSIEYLFLFEQVTNLTERERAKERSAPLFPVLLSVLN